MPKTNNNEQKYIVVIAEYDYMVNTNIQTEAEIVKTISNIVDDYDLNLDDIDDYITIIKVDTGKIMKIETKTTINLK